MLKFDWEKFKKKFMDSWKRDKRQHFILGAISASSLILYHFFGVWGLVGSLWIIQLVGYGLEAYQSTTPDRCVEANDAFATVAGGLFVLSIALTIYTSIQYLCIV